MKTFKFLSITLLIFALGTSVISCKQVKDADLQKNAETALAAIPGTDMVMVSVTDKVATLTGTVENDGIKTDAVSAVEAVENIKSVVNNIEVVPPAPDYSQIDATIQAALPDALKDHKGVEAEVKDGVVKLTGKIRKRDLPKLMEKISSLNPVSIDNQLTVK